MPLPTPKEDETKEQFITRCMGAHSKEGKFDLSDKKQRAQALAICYSKWASKTESLETVAFGNILREGL